MSKTALPELMLPQEVAHWLRMPTARVLRLTKKGLLPSLTLPDGEIVYARAELQAWFDKQRNESANARNDA